MLQFDNLTLSFSGVTLFEGVSFNVQKGEKCALVGRNGSGKSTLFRIVMGEMEAEKGSVSVPKDYKIGYLSQHIHFTKPTLLEEAACNLPEEELYKAEKILFGLGFNEEDLEKAPSSFSGGYHLRIHLAKVLISDPDCLLLDEPTNYLDILSIRWLTTFLKNWKKEFILISHDRDFLDSVCTHTIGIHRNKVKKVRGTTLAYFEQIVAEEEIHERTRLKTEKKHQKAMDFVERFGAKATKASQAQSRIKMIEREPVLEKLNAIDNLSFHFPGAPFPGKKMAEAKNLAFSYTDEPLIEDVSFQIEKGEKIAIIGKNGRGKSTLLRMIASDLVPKSGKLDLSDNIRIGYFGQTHISTLNPQNSIEDEIAEANSDLNFTQVKAIAGKMLFSGDLSQKKIAHLSGGEKSRVLLGKILARPCNLLILDEPTHHLDIESVEALIDALEDFEGAVLIVTHTELILRRIMPHKLIVCEKGKQTVFLGDYDLFLETKGWEEEKKPSKIKKEILKPKPVEAVSKKRVQKLEEEIAKFDALQKKALVEMEGGNFDPAFLKEISSREKKLEELYKELETLL